MYYLWLCSLNLLEVSACRVDCVPVVWRWVFHYVPPLVKLWSNHSKQLHGSWILLDPHHLCISCSVCCEAVEPKLHFNKCKENWALNLWQHDFQTTLTLSEAESGQQLNMNMQNSSLSTKTDRQLTTPKQSIVISRAHLCSCQGQLLISTSTVERECAIVMIFACLTCDEICVEILKDSSKSFATSASQHLELLRQLQGVRTWGTVCWLSKEMTLAEIQFVSLGQALLCLYLYHDISCYLSDSRAASVPFYHPMSPSLVR